MSKSFGVCERFFFLSRLISSRLMFLLLVSIWVQGAMSADATRLELRRVLRADIHYHCVMRLEMELISVLVLW